MIKTTKITIDNPSCTCDAIESTTHLYYTDQYSAIRQQFMHKTFVEH
jgi:hypothetical protein